MKHSIVKNRVYIGLGSNLGNPQMQILQAFHELAALPHTRVIARSSLYRSAPIGYLTQPDFVNAVTEIETGLPPRPLLDALQTIEERNDRQRHFRNAPRTLDLDILLYAHYTSDEHALMIPHPRMLERAFVLFPLLEIAPDCTIPGHGPATAFLAACGGQSVERLAA